MGFRYDVEIVWDDLLDAFENIDPETVYFLDRDTGEIFSVPLDYEDDDFWEEIEANEDRYLQIPDFDCDQERQLLHEFIKGMTDDFLKGLLGRAFMGNRVFGRLDDILSFYPDEAERLIALKDDLIAVRIRNWLRNNDLILSSDHH